MLLAVPAPPTSHPLVSATTLHGSRLATIRSTRTAVIRISYLDIRRSARL
jgi:hypothetical protein